ncbi:DUF3143 domain-containing protein [Leptolyngbya sp. FACHB-36]|uniref:DUF3143 domain-containing protein n=1 Tax=Leptolyngbya sp. FACHB-36 TaxID=2692808 RepID=UPI001680A1DB|nr:DUF3143 domain-containing protein [Leptolyngbya sp. FACHB-36]MBD2020382.1 DUF3143 domain-containing protein [Leptolyngbya sp. FACHB-36]
MALPPADTPLYNHPLPEIEQWLVEQGCTRSKDDIHCWLVQRPEWHAEVCLDTDQLTVRYSDIGIEERSVQRSFKYSLSRQDVQDAVFAGP